MSAGRMNEDNVELTHANISLKSPNFFVSHFKNRLEGKLTGVSPEPFFFVLLAGASIPSVSGGHHESFWTRFMCC